MSPTATGEPKAKAKAPPEPTPAKAAAKAPWQIVPIGVEQIDPSPYQPRLSFDPSETAELVASVKERGVQQPILVRTAKPQPQASGTNGSGTNGSGKPAAEIGSRRPRYELIAGERRLRACREAGRKTIPAIVRDDLSDRECAELALLENVQRSNLSVIEEARGYRQLMLRFGMKEERIARKVGKSVQTIQSMLRLLQLPEMVQHLLSQKKLTASHGQELLALAPFERVCTSVAQHAADNRVTAALLAANPLPNALELKRKGLLEELDHRTRFDWRSTCEACPHKAFLKSSYASYCLQPEEWKRKQEAAIAQAKDEAARAMEQVRAQVREQAEAQERDAQVDRSQLPPGSFRDLAYIQVPAGCTGQCPCRREARHPHDPEKTAPICLDPARLKSLQEQERKAHEEKRRRHFTKLWEQAVQVFEAQRDAPSKAAALLTSVILGGELHRYGYDAEGGALARGVARAAGLALPWDELLEASDEAAVLGLLAGPAPADAAQEADGADAASEQASEAPEPSRLLLFAASLLLAQEVRSAARFGGHTPRLGFVLGPEHEAQLELPYESEPDAGPAQDPPSEAASGSDEGFDPDADPFAEDVPDGEFRGDEPWDEEDVEGWPEPDPGP